MTNTERKLGEAKYFLKQLTPDFVHFDYILSAYLNAARSVTWIMRHEFNKVVGWEDWFNSCKISYKEKKLLKEINDFRIMSAKKTGIKTDHFFIKNLFVVEKEEDYLTVENFLSEFNEGDVVHLALYDENDEEFYSKSHDEDDFSIMLRRKDDDENSIFSRKSIYNLCNDYFVFLEKQVDICVGKYSNTSIATTNKTL
jgi:hypothetical protein